MMRHEEFVVVGLEDVEHAVDIASQRGWSSRRAPAAIRRELRVTRHCRILTRPDADIDVVITAGPLPCRAAGWWTNDDTVALDHLGLRFHTVLHTCAATDELVAELVRPVPALAV